MNVNGVKSILPRLAQAAAAAAAVFLIASGSALASEDNAVMPKIGAETYGTVTQHKGRDAVCKYAPAAPTVMTS